MAQEKRDPSFTAEIQEGLDLAQSRYQACEIDFGSDLDAWSQQFASDITASGVVYPKDGSIGERRQALTTALVHKRLRHHLNETEERLRRLSKGNGLTPGDADALSRLQQSLDAEEAVSPQFVDMIQQVRSKIAEVCQRIATK